MTISNIKTFKIETIDSETGTPLPEPTDPGTESALTDEEVLAMFGEDPTGGTLSDTGNAYSDHIIVDPRVNTDPDLIDADKLANFPPTVEQILISNESAARHLRLIKERYITTRDALINLKSDFTNMLYDLDGADARYIQDRILLLNNAIVKSDQQIETITRMVDDKEALWAEELRCGKDLDGDGLIGRPGDPNTIGVVMGLDKKLHYIDSTGKAIQNVMTDPDYSAKILDGDVISLIDESEAIGRTGEFGADPAMEPADLYLKINELRANYGNQFNTALDFGVPEYIWVPRDSVNIWEGKINEDRPTVSSYVFDKELWSNEGGLHQIVPEDKSKYVQIRVNKLLVESDELSFRASDGGKLYNTRVTLKDKNDVTIASFRFEGHFADNSAAAPIGDINGDGIEEKYVAFSNLAISFHDSDRASPIIFDASKYFSTGRQIIDNLAATLDMTRPTEARDERRREKVTDRLNEDNKIERMLRTGEYDPSDEERAYLAFEEHRSLYEDKDFVSKFWYAHDEEHGEWFDLVHPDESFGVARQYDDLHDRYISTTNLPNQYDTVQSYTRGVSTVGLRGVLTGSNSNDIFIVPSVNDLSDYVREHQPEQAEEIIRGNPLYATVIQGGTGNDIVRAYEGDLYATDITFAYVEAGRHDTVVLEVATRAPSNSTERRNNTNNDIRSSGTDNGCTIEHETEATLVQDIGRSDARYESAPVRIEEGEIEDFYQDTKCYVNVTGSQDVTLYDNEELNEDLSDKPSSDWGYHNDFFAGITGTNNILNTDIVGQAGFSQSQFEPESLTDLLLEEDSIKVKIIDSLTGFGFDDFEYTANLEDDEEGGYAATQEAELNEFFDQVNSDLDSYRIDAMNSLGLL